MLQLNYCSAHLTEVPAQATNVLARLEPNPYPEDKLLLLLSQSVQLVDETKRPVPLSEVRLLQWPLWQLLCSHGFPKALCSIATIRFRLLCGA